jgi:hypothetical protein
MSKLKPKTLILVWISIFAVTFITYLIIDTFEKENKPTVVLTLQYISDCIYSKDFIKNTKTAISELNLNIELNEVMISTDEHAKEYKFRGSPTLLINGIDLMNMPEPRDGSFSCRVYTDGLPDVNFIKNRITEIINYTPE